MTDTVAYKIMTADEHAAMRRDGVFHGSPVDRQDGFIHLSAAGQVAATAARHFAGQAGLVLVGIDLARLPDPVRWEPSRGGALFPHVYGTLPMAAVVSVSPIDPASGDPARVLPGDP